MITLSCFSAPVIHIPEDYLMRLAEFKITSKPYTGSLHSPKRFSDYQEENEGYAEVVGLLRNFTSGGCRECYRCELYPAGYSHTFLSKFCLMQIASTFWEWIGKMVHPSALETFLGHSICIRCSLSILLSEHPIVSMRSELRWEPPEEDAASYRVGLSRSSSSPGLLR